MFELILSIFYFMISTRVHAEKKTSFSGLVTIVRLHLTRTNKSAGLGGIHLQFVDVLPVIHIILQELT